MSEPRPSGGWRTIPNEWWGLGLLCLGLMLLFAVRTPIDLGDPIIMDATVSHAFAPDEATSDTLSLLHGKWSRSPGGVTAGDSTASLELELPPGPWTRVRVFLVGDERPNWTIRLQREHGSFMLTGVRAGEEAIIGGKELPPWTDPASRIRLRLAPRAQGEAGGLLRQVRIRCSIADAVEVLPPYPGVVFGGLVPLAVCAFLTLSGRRKFSSAARIGGIAGVAAAAIFLYNRELLAVTWLAAASLFLGASSSGMFRWLFPRPGEDPAARLRAIAIAEWCAFAAIIGFALWVRWEVLQSERFAPLRPDALGYLQIALRPGFYATALDHAPWVREPLFPAFLRAWFLLFPATETSARFATLLVGVGCVALTHLAGRRLFSPVVGLIAAGAYALTPFLCELSVSGLREELLTLLLLAFVCLSIYAGPRPWVRSIGAGILLGALALLRVNNLFLGVLLMALPAWRDKWRPAEIALALVLLVLPSVPHLAFNAALGGGDPLYSSSVHTRYYLNLLHLGEVGYPASRAEWTTDPYAGPVVSNLRLLTDGGVIAGIVRVLKGFVKVFFTDFPHGELFRGNELVMALGLIGAWALGRRREAWWIVAAFVLFLCPVAVIAGIRFDHRLAAAAAPMIFWVWGAGVTLAFSAAPGLLRGGNNSKPPSPS